MVTALHYLYIFSLYTFFGLSAQHSTAFFCFCFLQWLPVGSKKKSTIRQQRERAKEIPSLHRQENQSLHHRSHRGQMERKCMCIL
ncbi:hypothetical protein J3E72DRAFT_341618, partial [Bipolaris maydis]|uniref:uncharacterized protein n=1 Tax=Cochliobolus heterostrophus TaxID=5016 RepID=UPI0024D236C4